MRDHEQFVEMCALAVIGDLSEEERQQLEMHLANCKDCHSKLRQFRDVLENWVPLADDGVRHMRKSVLLTNASRRARDAFIVRARRDGLQLTAAAARSGGFWSAALWYRFRSYMGPVLVTGCLLIAAAAISILAGRKPDPTYHPAARTTPDLTEIATLKAELSTAKKWNAEQGVTIATLGRERATALDQSRQVEQLLEMSQRQAQLLRNELAKAHSASAEAQQRLTAELRKNEDLDSQLSSLRDVQAQGQASAVAAQARIQDLSEQVRLQAVTLDHERDLLAVDRDIRDLMGARNLHILDVHDFDLKGKAQKSFGRVFYTEAKSLIFYAYDLPTKIMKNASFQAWGQRTNGSKQAISLGLLYVDDQKQARWALKFDDPDVLRQIDSVFVTIEPPGGTKQPSGQKLLYAWLGNSPNHP
jgi:hypothetical protein